MVYENALTTIFIFCFMAKILVQFYLDQRNLQHVQKHQEEVPELFAGQISLAEHQKAANYSRARSQFGRFNILINAGVLIFWTLGGGLEILNQIVLRLTSHAVYHGLGVFLLFGTVQLIISLPLNYYEQFVIEEKFGFNRSSLKIFFTDLCKQIIVSILLGAPLLAGFFWIMQKIGELWWLYAWLFLSAFQLLILLIYPSLIAPLFNKFTPLSEGDLKQKIATFLQKVDFPFQGLYVMDASRRSSHGNAYFTGFGKHKRIVFFDTLINSLEDEETLAVLSHEIGHSKKKHVIKGLLKSLITSLLGLYVLALCIKWPLFYTDHGVDTPNLTMAFLIYLLVSPIYLYFFIPINSYFSRKYEYEADHFAHENSDSEKLISALVKMYKDNASTLTPDPLYSSFYHSHPPALQRVQYLQSLAAQKS